MSNLFIVREGQLCTPPLDRGCLAGIIRGKVLELAANLGQPCTERPVELDDLRLAEEVFLTSSLVRILPVVEIPGLRQELPRGPGPRTRALQQALAALERVSWVEGK